MRLIDADGLIPRRWNGARGQYEPCVDDAPTIEAIPIEWLKEFAADYVRTSDKDSKVWIFCLIEAIGRWREEQGNE